MKKTITKFEMAMLISITALVFNGCKGKDGAPGATGPAGAKGNANVNTYLFSSSSATWTLVGVSYTGYYVNIAMDLTGGVEVFVFDNSISGWVALPLTQNGTTCSFEVTSSTIWINFAAANGTSSINNPGVWNFKAITIPPAIRRQNPNINYKDYKEVARTFNLN